LWVSELRFTDSTLNNYKYIQKTLKRTSELTIKILTVETSVLSILNFLTMEHGFMISQFALKSCHLMVYQSNDQIGWISPCETTKENVSYSTKTPSSKKSKK